MTTSKKKARVRKPRPTYIFLNGEKRRLNPIYTPPGELRAVAAWLIRFADWSESRKK